MKGRLLGVDFGHARIGLAVSDPLHLIASPLATIRGSKNPVTAATNVAAEVRKLKMDIDQIIVGLPLHMNGSESERSAEVRSFACALEEQTGISVQLFDERLTSVQAERLMKHALMTRRERSSSIDGVSSTILLQSFLDLQGTMRS